MTSGNYTWSFVRNIKAALLQIAIKLQKKQNEMKYITLLLLFSTLVLCRALPVESGADNGVVVSNPNANPFDLGAVTECRRPSTNVCSIDYDVPASIASLAEIIEFDIQGRLSNPIVALRGGESCRAGYLQTLCAFRFPRCDGTNVVMRSLPNCTQATARCSSSLKQLITAEGLCQLQATVPLDSCAPLSESQVEFQHCSVVEESTSVTAWMLEYMNLIDEELVEKFIPNNSVSSLWNPPACSATTAQYYCQFYGQCTGNGRIEVKNTEGFCDNVINW